MVDGRKVLMRSVRERKMCSDRDDVKATILKENKK